MKGVTVLTFPPGVTTLIFPVVAPLGTVTLIFVAVSTVIVPLTPLKVTLVTPFKLVPLIVTTVPTGPEVGLKLLIVGVSWVEISLTVLLSKLATQTWVPSEETLSGSTPTVMVWTTEPVEASSSFTVPAPPSPTFVTQTWVPSEETPSGPTKHGDGLDHRAGRGVKLGHRFAIAIDHPDVGADPTTR